MIVDVRMRERVRGEDESGGWEGMKDGSGGEVQSENETKSEGEGKG